MNSSYKLRSNFPALTNFSRESPACREQQVKVSCTCFQRTGFDRAKCNKWAARATGCCLTRLRSRPAYLSSSIDNGNYY